MPLRSHPVTQHMYAITSQLLVTVITVIWCFCGLPILFVLSFLLVLFSAIVYISRCVCNRISEQHKSTRLAPDEWALLNKVGSSAVVQCLVFLNAPIVLSRLRERIEGVVTRGPTANMLNNLTRRLILEAPQPLWREVSNFEISNHVRENSTLFETMEEVEKFVDKCSSEGLDMASPMWEIKSCTFKQEGFLLLRFHPCVVSGTTAVSLLCSSLADNDCEYSSPHRFPGKLTWTSSLNSIIRLPFLLLESRRFQAKEKQFRTAFFSKDRNFDTICKGRKTHAWSDKIHLPSLRHTASVLRTSVSVVSLSALATSIRLLPNNFKDAEIFPVKLLYDFNNSLSSSRGLPPSYREANIIAPCNIEGAVPCLWTLRQTMTSLKQNLFPYLTNLALRLLRIFSSEKLPLKLLSSLMVKRALCIFTSLSGSTGTLYICGRRVQNICMWYPVTSEVIFSSSMMTYADECRICVEAWENCGIDPHQLVKECHRQIEILIDLMKNRQIPKKKKSVFYDDSDLDDLDLNCDDDIQETTSTAQTGMHLARVFFERSPKVESVVNGLPGGDDRSTSKMARNMEIDGAVNKSHSKNFANSSQCEDFGMIEQAAPAHVSNDGASNQSPTADLEVGIEISPAVERRNSAALL